MRKPSVTKLLDILAKPALIEWANRKGLEGIDIVEYRAQKMQSGTDLHKEIEMACKGEGWFSREIDGMNFKRFFAGKKILANEGKIETEWFVGRYDISFVDSDGVEYIADFKRGYKRTYLEHKLQLIAYTMARPAEMAIIPIPQFQMVPIAIQNRKPYENILKNLSAIYYARKELE
jgi:hypothetical protein